MCSWMTIAEKRWVETDTFPNCSQTLSVKSVKRFVQVDECYVQYFVFLRIILMEMSED